METILGIHLNIPEPFARRILEAIRKTQIVYPRNYTYTPHMTLYLCRFSARRFPVLIHSLEALQLKPVRITPIGVRAHRHKNHAFLSLDLVRTSTILQLHAQILRIANPMRGNLLRSRDKSRLAQNIFSAKERRLLSQYGYHRVAGAYRPHITLGEIAWKQGHSRVTQLTKTLRTLNGIKITLSHLVIGMYRYDQATETYTEPSVERLLRLT
ncbi:MAG: 2'-5' RNA ligase family protein [Patescibacteria group bacterium]|jgi:2'-5' RNA ligase